MQLLPYLIDLWNPVRHRHKFKDLEHFCMFVGYPRSGHSIIGAMLDAHSEMSISHEVHVLKILDEGTTKWRIFLEILKRSKNQAATGRIQNIYSYQIDNQYQGKYTKLKIIGDKKGGGSALMLAEKPELLNELQEMIALPIKLIHITRNPFDAISTSLIRRHEKREKPYSKKQLEKEIEEFFIKAQSIKNIKENSTFKMFEMTQELFISDIEKNLKDLCNFLGVKTSDDYLNSCTEITNSIPNKSRFDVAFWEDDLIGDTLVKMRKFDFFQSYTFNQ
jgi:hypothetical protein